MEVGAIRDDCSLTDEIIKIAREVCDKFLNAISYSFSVYCDLKEENPITCEQCFHVMNLKELEQENNSTERLCIRQYTCGKCPVKAVASREEYFRLMAAGISDATYDIEVDECKHRYVADDIKQVESVEVKETAHLTETKNDDCASASVEQTEILDSKSKQTLICDGKGLKDEFVEKIEEQSKKILTATKTETKTETLEHENYATNTDIQFGCVKYLKEFSAERSGGKTDLGGMKRIELPYAETCVAASIECKCQLYDNKIKHEIEDLTTVSSSNAGGFRNQTKLDIGESVCSMPKLPSGVSLSAGSSTESAKEVEIPAPKPPGYNHAEMNLEYSTKAWANNASRNTVSNSEETVSEEPVIVTNFSTTSDSEMQVQSDAESRFSGYFEQSSSHTISSIELNSHQQQQLKEKTGKSTVIPFENDSTQTAEAPRQRKEHRRADPPVFNNEAHRILTYRQFIDAYENYVRKKSPLKLARKMLLLRGVWRFLTLKGETGNERLDKEETKCLETLQDLKITLATDTFEQISSKHPDACWLDFINSLDTAVRKVYREKFRKSSDNESKQHHVDSASQPPENASEQLYENEAMQHHTNEKVQFHENKVNQFYQNETNGTEVEQVHGNGETNAIENYTTQMIEESEDQRADPPVFNNEAHKYLSYRQFFDAYKHYVSRRRLPKLSQRLQLLRGVWTFLTLKKKMGGERLDEEETKAFETLQKLKMALATFTYKQVTVVRPSMSWLEYLNVFERHARQVSEDETEQFDENEISQNPENENRQFNEDESLQETGSQYQGNDTQRVHESEVKSLHETEASQHQVSQYHENETQEVNENEVVSLHEADASQNVVRQASKVLDENEIRQLCDNKATKVSEETDTLASGDHELLENSSAEENCSETTDTKPENSLLENSVSESRGNGDSHIYEDAASVSNEKVTTTWETAFPVTVVEAARSQTNMGVAGQNATPKGNVAWKTIKTGICSASKKLFGHSSANREITTDIEAMQLAYAEPDCKEPKPRRQKKTAFRRLTKMASNVFSSALHSNNSHGVQTAKGSMNKGVDTGREMNIMENVRKTDKLDLAFSKLTEAVQRHEANSSRDNKVDLKTNTKAGAGKIMTDSFVGVKQLDHNPSPVKTAKGYGKHKVKTSLTAEGLISELKALSLDKADVQSKETGAKTARGDPQSHIKTLRTKKRQETNGKSRNDITTTKSLSAAKAVKGQRSGKKDKSAEFKAAQQKAVTDSNDLLTSPATAHKQNKKISDGNSVIKHTCQSTAEAAQKCIPGRKLYKSAEKVSTGASSLYNTIVKAKVGECLCDPPYHYHGYGSAGVAAQSSNQLSFQNIASICKTRRDMLKRTLAKFIQRCEAYLTEYERYADRFLAAVEEAKLCNTDIQDAQKEIGRDIVKTVETALQDSTAKERETSKKAKKILMTITVNTESALAAAEKGQTLLESDTRPGDDISLETENTLRFALLDLIATGEDLAAANPREGKTMSRRDGTYACLSSMQETLCEDKQRDTREEIEIISKIIQKHFADLHQADETRFPRHLARRRRRQLFPASDPRRRSGDARNEAQQLNSSGTDEGASQGNVDVTSHIETNATVDYSTYTIEPQYGNRPNKKKLFEEVKQKTKTRGKANKHLIQDKFEEIFEDYSAISDDIFGDKISLEDDIVHVTDESEAEVENEVEATPEKTSELKAELDDREFNMVAQEIIRKDDDRLRDIEHQYTIGGKNRDRERKKRKDKKDRTPKKLTIPLI